MSAPTTNQLLTQIAGLLQQQNLTLASILTESRKQTDLLTELVGTVDNEAASLVLTFGKPVPQH